MAAATLSAALGVGLALDVVGADLVAGDGADRAADDGAFGV